MKVWILVLIIIFAVNAFAESEELSHLQHRECNLSLLAEIPTSIGIFGHLKGISYRNYLGNIPEMTGEMQIQAMQQLIQPWGQRIYAVNSVEEARAKNEMMIHRNIPPEKRDSNHYISPPEAYLFVLTNEDPDSYFKFYDHKPEKHHEIDAYFRRLAAETEVFYFDLAGNKVNLTEEEVHQIKNIHYNMNNEKDHFFYFTGWFSPLYIGVESIQRFKTSENNPQKYSNAYKTLSKLMRKLYEQGVRVTFNRDMDKVLQLAGLQERIGKSNKVSKKTDVEKTRFKKSFRDAYLALQATGNSYSVEVWSGDPDDPNTQLIGGTFGTMTGSYVKVDSLAYVSTRKVR
ncbi:MAG: hypothetical protein KDD40_11630, partial [Bdellovibrionales bacterium]|nr:hypothetical protein [Bdellovibrionales bacterium]